MTDHFAGFLDLAADLTDAAIARPRDHERGREGVDPQENPSRWPTILDLLAERRQRRIRLVHGGDRLLIDDPHGTLTPDFETALRARTVELLGLLRDCQMLGARRDED